MTIMTEGIYTGNGIIFDNNEANTIGGAVLATTQSVFICNDCRFTNNKAELGGGIYVELASRTDISSSIFN